jgi:hypothetical protein
MSDTDTRVLVTYDGAYTWGTIANTPEAGRRQIVAQVKREGYEPSEYMKDIDNYRVTPVAELIDGVSWL